MTIVAYRGALDIDVQFEDGSIVKNREYSKFKKGQIRNPYKPDVYEVGFVGVGGYIVSENRKNTKTYDAWNNMLQRCYSGKYPTYKCCKVCEEWHNFQVFAKWYEENIWNDDCRYLDKDILVKDNKTYSPNTCVLVDNRLNLLFVKRDNDRGKYPIGVSYRKGVKKFQAYCKVVINGKNQQKHLGYYNTPFEAFQAYKHYKENYIKQVADEYKSKYTNFPNKLYKAMYDYKVEIDD